MLGPRRFRLRELLNVDIEGPVTAAGRNLARLLTATRWRQRRALGGNLAALPKPPPRLATTCRKTTVR